MSQPKIHKLHSKFNHYWPEYKRKDIIDVCKALITLTGLKKKGNDIQTIQDNWGAVCNFLVRWERK